MTQTPDKRILIVEDEPLIAFDLSDFLQSLGYKVLAICHDSETALDKIHIHQPDLVLLDIHIEGSKDGIQVAQSIREQYDIPYVFLTSFSDEMTLGKAGETMPYGYIVKPFDEKSLKATISIALARHQQQLQRTSQDNSKEKIDALCTTPLTSKEYDILMDMSKGNSNKELAALHEVSPNTIKYHLKNIFLKLGVESRSEALHRILS